MTVLYGPAASGKTTRILEAVKSYLNARSSGFRVLVPTAASADQIRRRLANEGYLFNPCLITTLSRFITEIAPDLVLATAPQIDAAIRESLAELSNSAFKQVEHYPGFRARMMRIIDEFSAASANASNLKRALQSVPYQTAEQNAFAFLYERVGRKLTEQKLWWADPRMLVAASRISTLQDEIFVDGFFSFSTPQRQLLQAIPKITLTLPSDWPEASAEIKHFRNASAGIEILPASHRVTKIRKVEAPTRDRETDEIARRVLEIIGTGTPFSGIGVVIRQENPYVPLLRAAFNRFGIPARFHFNTRLEDQSPIRFLTAILDALVAGWDRTELLKAVQLSASGLGGTPEGDIVDFAIRESLPGFGLQGIARLEEKLAPLEEWRDLTRTPAQWAKALIQLQKLAFENIHIIPANQESAEIWRIRAEALNLWQNAIEMTAECLRSNRIALEEFWTETKNTIRLTSLRISDRRANTVHVMDAFEVRQWRFPYIFVCGMLEGEFPQRASAEPIFDEAIRQALRENNIPVKLNAERQAIEDALPLLAASRADREVTFTWPAFNALGEPALRSFVLDEFDGAIEPAIPCRVQPSVEPNIPSRIASVGTDLIQQKISPEKKWHPTEIEIFLQCPFKYFGSKTLQLQSPPRRPEERFGPLEHGSLVHSMLRRLSEGEIHDLEAAYEVAFRDVCRKVHVVESHHLEWHRLEMLRNLRAYLSSAKRRPGWTSYLEWAFEFSLIPGLTIRGRIDRFDESPDKEAFAIDYKYSNSDTIKKKLKGEVAVQGGLYLLALKASGYNPYGFAYVPLRGDAEPFEDFEVAVLMDDARERTIGAVTQIRSGRIEAAPADAGNCKWCDFRDACRIREAATSNFTIAQGFE